MGLPWCFPQFHFCILRVTKSCYSHTLNFSHTQLSLASLNNCLFASCHQCVDHYKGISSIWSPFALKQCHSSPTMLPEGRFWNPDLIMLSANSVVFHLLEVHSGSLHNIMDWPSMTWLLLMAPPMPLTQTNWKVEL